MRRKSGPNAQVTPTPPRSRCHFQVASDSSQMYAAIEASRSDGDARWTRAVIWRRSTVRESQIKIAAETAMRTPMGSHRRVRLGVSLIVLARVTLRLEQPLLAIPVRRPPNALVE